MGEVLAVRKIAERFSNGHGLMTKIYYNAWTGEFITKFYRGGQHLPNADYFTNNREDAITTAEAELQRMSVFKPAS